MFCDLFITIYLWKSNRQKTFADPDPYQNVTDPQHKHCCLKHHKPVRPCFSLLLFAITIQAWKNVSKSANKELITAVHRARWVTLNPFSVQLCRGKITDFPCNIILLPGGSIVDLHLFQCRSVTSFLSQCGSGSESDFKVTKTEFLHYKIHFVPLVSLCSTCQREKV